MTTQMKFQDPHQTLDGSERAWVPFTGLETLWFNTGSLCNLTCANCYMESSPTNDALVYLTAAEVMAKIDEASRSQAELKQVGFTGGEPFLNPEMMPMIKGGLERDFEVLILTNAMKPMRRREADLLQLDPSGIVFRVSLDHHTADHHDSERGEGGFEETLAGMQWLSANGFRVHCAGRSLWNEDSQRARQKYQELFASRDISLEQSESGLIIFPEMKDGDTTPPEITTGCWDILKKESTSVMCANSRMVVKRRGEDAPSIVRCTLLPYDPYFDSGTKLEDSFEKTHLKHVYCAQFCVLGGASCAS